MTQYVIINSPFDDSGVVQVFGPYESEEKADAALGVLMEWPLVQISGGRWTVHPMTDTNQPITGAATTQAKGTRQVLTGLAAREGK